MKVIENPLYAAIAAVSIILITAALCVFVLHIATGQDNNQEPKTSTAQSIKKHEAEATAAVKAAGENEQLGQTDLAIKNYEKALTAYRAAGDKAGESSVLMQLEYLKSLK